MTKRRPTTGGKSTKETKDFTKDYKRGKQIMMNLYPTINEMKSSNAKLQFVNKRNCYRYESRKLLKLYKIKGQIVAKTKDDEIFNSLLFVQNIQITDGNGASYAYQLKRVVKMNGCIRFYFQ